MSRAARLAPYVCLGAGLFLFLLSKLYSLHPHRGDEGIYFYDALRLSQGARLYRDLFFAHPPLHLVIPTVLTWLFGWSLPLMKMVSPLAALAQGVLVCAIARRVLDSRWAGVVAALALLFCEDFLKASSYATGINEAGALLCGALLLLVLKRPIAAGALAGAATMTLLQVAPIAAGFGLYAITTDRKRGLCYGAGLVAVVALVHAWCALRGGVAFFDQVYLYHVRKSGEGGLRILSLLSADDLTLFVGGALGMALFFRETREEPRRFLQVLGPIALLHIVAITTRPRIFPFYFQPIFPLFALALGWLVSHGVNEARTAKTARARSIGMALAACALLAPTALRTPLTAIISPTRAEQHRSYTQRYVWRDAPLLGPLNGAVRALFFGGGEREAGRYYWPITEYLWNQSRRFDSHPEIVEAVRASSAEDATVFGDSTSLPLVALDAGRRIAADFADTNVQRFIAGLPTADAAVAQLEAAPPALVLVFEGGGMGGLPAFRAWLATRYQTLRQFADAHGDRYTLYRRR